MKICVVGTGTMGGGIVQTIAQAGIEIWMKGRSQASIDRAVNKIESGLKRLVDREKITEDKKDEIVSKIHTTLSFDDIKDSDLIIEAIAEDIELKKETLRQLDEICKPESIFATNTSSFSITELSMVTNRPEMVIGMHFFNPVPIMKLVEVIKGQHTNENVYNVVLNLTEEIGKTAVTVNESPGFVVNRLLIPMINEGIATLADGAATKEEIDTAMKLGASHPMGPLALADLIGLDVCLAIMEVLHNEFGDDKYRPHPLMRKMVRAKLLGRKTGKGFYDYNR